MLIKLAWGGVNLPPPSTALGTVSSSTLARMWFTLAPLNSGLMPQKTLLSGPIVKVSPVLHPTLAGRDASVSITAHKRGWTKPLRGMQGA